MYTETYIDLTVLSNEYGKKNQACKNGIMTVRGFFDSQT